MTAPIKDRTLHAHTKRQCCHTPCPTPLQLLQLITMLTNWDKRTHVYKTRLQTKPRHSIRHTSPTNKPDCVLCNSSAEGQPYRKTCFGCSPETEGAHNRPCTHFTPAPRQDKRNRQQLDRKSLARQEGARITSAPARHISLACTIGYTWL